MFVLLDIDGLFVLIWCWVVIVCCLLLFVSLLSLCFGCLL